MYSTDDEYFDSDEFREMLATYEEAVSQGQPVFLDADELAEIADYYQMTGHADQADEAITLALSLSPGAVMPLVYKIHEALYYGRTDEAEQLLDQIIEKDSPDYVYAEGEIMLAKGQDREADAFFKDQFKTMPPSEYQDFIIDVANIMQDYGYAERAMQWMKRAHHEDSAEYKELMARTLFGLGKYDDSEKLWTELIDDNPFSKRYWNALASAQFMNEDYSNAVESSEYALAIDPEDPDGLVAKANSLYRLGNFEQALEFFRRYSEQVPDDEFALMNQGTCLVNLERTDEAIDMLSKALETAPDDSPYLPDIYQELAFAYSENGHYDEAIRWLEKTKPLECDHVQVLVVKGHILLAAGRMKEAETCFRDAVLASDSPHQTLLRIIVSLYDNKYVETSYALFKKFFLIVPEGFAEGYAYMALCCYDLKKWDEFLHYLKEACLVNPKECQIALAHLFPEDVKPEDYYQYMITKLKK